MGPFNIIIRKILVWTILYERAINVCRHFSLHDLVNFVLDFVPHRLEIAPLREWNKWLLLSIFLNSELIVPHLTLDLVNDRSKQTP